jgi:hypothetical protein
MFIAIIEELKKLLRGGGVFCYWELRFLRRHYPDQVRGSQTSGLPLSPATPSSPCYLIVYHLNVAGQV